MLWKGKEEECVLLTKAKHPLATEREERIRERKLTNP
jgi:hypothetical protein